MKQILFVAIASVSFLFFSCNRIRHKGGQIADSAKQKASSRMRYMADKVNPEFDSYQKDTKFNKLRFKEFLQVEISADVTSIYCYADRLGIDSKFQFSFNCNTTTLNKIIAKHHLVADTITADPLGIPTEFEWWNNKKIGKLKSYSKKEAENYYQYIWYDTVESKAHYLDFDT